MFKRFVYFAILVFSTSTAIAHHHDVKPTHVNDHDTTTITDESGCKVYNPMPQQGESISWDGVCLKGFADGEGTLKWFINGELKEHYVGNLVNGWAEGSGVYTSHDGTQYDGEWVRSRQNGRGVQLNPDGSAYDGEWLNGRAHGWGRFRSSNGEIFEGEWRNGEPLDEPDGRRI
jgi:hypothetical protein